MEPSLGYMLIGMQVEPVGIGPALEPIEPFLRYILRWPSVEHFMHVNAWAWPMCETFHFIGLALGVGIVGMFDLRVLGFARALPLAPLQRLIPWAVFGFFLAFASGIMFVTGVGANLIGTHPYEVLITDLWLQLKLLFLILAGLNAFAFYVFGVSREVDLLGPGDDAPPTAKVIAATSLSLWIAVVYVGRLIPWGL